MHRLIFSDYWTSRQRRGPRARGRALALALMLLVTGAARAQSFDLAASLRRLDREGACAAVQIIGECRCAGIVCGLRVHRYVPVAFVETTVAPGDSLLSLARIPVPGLLGTVSSTLSSTDNTSEAHVWRLGPVWTAGLPCLYCSAASAAVPSAVVDTAAPVCGPAGAVVQAITAADSLTALLPLPSLAYASELDWLNWRTGCRDLADPAASVLGAQLACSAPLADIASSTTTGAGCIGAWGALRPRQMRDIGPVPLLHSAKTAVRAMSIARDQLGTFPFPVDTQGKLQQVYPAISACFGVGQLPLPQAPGSSQPALTSPDGRYGWIYWRATTCCVGLPSAAQCLRLPLR